MKNKILNIKNLSKSYGAFKVTDEIAIDLNFDEIHALIGPNGAGKSTLIKQIVEVLSMTLVQLFWIKKI